MQAHKSKTVSRSQALGVNCRSIVQDYHPPQTGYDHPDRQGVWNFSTHAPFERPIGYGDV